MIITSITSTPRALPFITTALLLLPACADDDSSATTEGSSSTTASPDPSTSSSTALGSTSTADTGTGASSTGATGATGTDTGTGIGTSSTAADSDTASDGSTGAAGLEIAGEWLEEFAPGMGITHVIDEVRWDQLAMFGDAIFHVATYDNAERYVVAQGDGANEFSPGLWSRFDWTWDGDTLYYCTAVFDGATAEDALTAPASEPDDLEMGCGGFPWSLLMPVQ
jgi:hypothetical protein